VGATGMVGGYALRYALEDLAAGSVTAIVRRSLGISHPKLKEVLHRYFADCSALAEALSGQDAAVFCLGAYTGMVSGKHCAKHSRRVSQARPNCICWYSVLSDKPFQRGTCSVMKWTLGWRDSSDLRAKVT
jgi:uncharacterized protein YbjT (DUF2867 family)